ncbi:hypothetical protein [Actinoallomurus purpureus]|nr:hypothetical protein [Actinoallomurus purpureus]
MIIVESVAGMCGMREPGPLGAVGGGGAREHRADEVRREANES